MAVKYSINFKDDFDVSWRADIDLPNYVGDTTNIRGVGRASVIPEWTPEEIDDPFSAVITSKVALQFYNEEHAIVDIEELQLLKDMEGRVHIYKENVLWWSGFILADGIQRNFKPYPYQININAVDGLALLDDIPFIGMSNWPMQEGVEVRSPLAYIREVLFKNTHLDLPLPIRWESSIECNYFPGEDAFAGSVKWSARGEGFDDFNGNDRSCLYVLKGMVDAIQGRIFQFGGKWHIIRVNDIVDGIYNWKEIDTTYQTGAPIQTSGTEDIKRNYRIVSENHVITIKPALTDAIVRYDHAMPENILPNGSMDAWIQVTQTLLHWGFTTMPTGVSNPMQGKDLTGRGGQSAILEYGFQGAGDDAIFQLYGDNLTDLGLPLDAHTLFKRMTFGFTICPTNGFPYNTENGIINWDSEPLRIRVSYNIDDGTGGITKYYLNAYGYWQFYPTEGYLRISDYTENVDAGIRSMHYTFSGLPIGGDIIKLNWKADGPPVSEQESLITVDDTTEFDLNATLQALAAELPPLFTYVITNLGLGSYLFTVRCEDSFYNDGHHVGSGSSSINDDLTIPLSVDGAAINDIIKFQFQGRGGSSNITIPDPGDLDNIANPLVGKLYIEFFLKDGQRYLLDEVWMNTDENNDIYHSRVLIGEGTNKREKSIQISSSFTGSVVSNFMTTFTKSNEQYIFNDGVYEGSLTGMTANAIMRFRSKSNKIFNGDIYTDGLNWMFHNMYNFEGLSGINFLPLSSKYNIETGIVEIVAIEARDDTETVLEEKHYGSNARLLSEANIN